MSAPFDLWDQAVLTEVINRPLTTVWEDQPFLGEAIAPNMSVASRVFKLRKTSVLSFGKGKFKSPGASPLLWKPDQTWSESEMELVMLEEAHRIQDELWIRLNSVDENVRKASGVDLVTRGQLMAIRNKRLLEWMRWQAFQGSMLVPYENGSQDLYIDYGFPSGHKPTVGTLWTDTTNSDPISDLRSFANQIAASSGYFGVNFHMGSTTWDYIIRNTKVRNLLTATGRSMLIPTQDDILNLLRRGSNFTIYDNGYRDESAGDSRGVPGSLTRYLPDGYVLVTCNYAIEGMPIAQTIDGQVLVNDGYNSVAIRQGAQSEVIVDPLTKDHILRYGSANMIRINYPEAFLWAKVA